MRTLLLIASIALIGCEKDEPMCGAIVGHILTGQAPNYGFAYVLRDEYGNLFEMPTSAQMLNANDYGQILCTDR